MAIRLQPRDLDLLAHLACYRLSTVEVLALVFFTGSVEALKSTLKRLKKAGLIASEKLFPRGNDVYYYLTPTGAVAAGLSEKSGHATSSPDDVARYYGQLLFCCAGSVRRPKLSLEAFDSVFPGLRTDALTRRFPYDCFVIDVDPAGERRLARVFIDTGSSEIAFRTKRALADDGAVLPAFVSEGRYALAAVVATEQKAKAVERQLAASPLLDPRGERIRVVVEAHDALGRLLLGGDR